MDDVFTCDVAVRYLEVDQQGVVFNMWYLAYFDEAMTALLAANGVAYDDLTAAGYEVMLVHSEIDWHGGLRWGDSASIAVSCARLGTTSFALDFRLCRAGGELVVEGTTVYVAVDGTRSATALPDLLRKGVGPVRPLRQRGP